MAKKKIGVALIGFGTAGELFHAPFLKTTDGLEVTVVATGNTERAKKASSIFPEATIAGSIEVALKDHSEKFELVVVASPNKHHYSQTKAALEAGKAVVVDKPFAINSKECRELIDLAKRVNRLLTVYQNRRWDNDFLTIQKFLKKGTLSDIARFESRFERFRPKLDGKKWRETTGSDEGGGLLFDLGSHLIDQACLLFGTPNSVYCEIDKRRAGVRSDDDVFIALEFAGGVRAHLYANILSAIPGPRFRVLAMNGGYEKFGLDPQEDALRAGILPTDKSFGVEDVAQTGKLAIERDGKIVVEKLTSEIGNYGAFYAAVRDAINSNGPAPVNPEHALRTISIIEHAKQSAQLERKLDFQTLVVAR